MYNRIRSIFIQDGKIMAVSLGVGLLLAFGVAAYSYVYSHAAQRDIASNVIRFHVRANSNTIADINLKEHVRTEVLAAFEPYLSQSTDIQETRAVLSTRLDEIQSHAEAVIRAAGHNYPVTAEMTQKFFPTRFYGNMSFPPGEYEAVTLVIGEGAGSNWWCLMFPPLCYVDMTATTSGRQQLASTVSEESFLLLTHMEEQDPGLTVRFRVVEWWQNREEPTAQFDIARR